MVYSLSLAAFTVLGVFLQWLLRFFRSSRKEVKQNTNNHDVTLRAPYPCNAIKGNQKFRITMGLRKLDEWNWLTVDKNYLKEHDIRDSLLRNQRENVFECLPESKAACAEVLEVVAEFLCERYPSMFLMENHGTMKKIHNAKTGESFVIGDANSTTEPLEIAARLAMEDLSVLMKNEDGEYYLYEINCFQSCFLLLIILDSAASATLFPVGWSVQNRIGWTISQMHSPVPEWHSKVGLSVNK